MCVVGGGNKELRFAPNDLSKKGPSGLHIPLGHKELDLWIFICPVLVICMQFTLEMKLFP
jgi:hypothetical protein